MTLTDLLYRAFLEYRKQTASKEAGQRREAIARADAEKDRLTVTRTSCVIEEDWIEAIERGLPFLEKAIGEERQFILSNGETVEIEKVKHVSRESVEHLARHSNYISREQKGNDIIPDRLYTVERLNDYSVYENRFLYMVLCNLRDFVSLRYHKILELTNTYTGEVKFDKVVNLNKERLVYRMELSEERKDDPYLLEHNPMKDAVDRIDLILRSVYFYLRTPLMLEVAKVDKLKPPITKTNVLRMDKNFKEVVALYEFLSSYTKDGYTVLKEEKTIAPLPGAFAEEFAETAMLASFLTYEHGLGIEDYLEAEYEKEEARRREAEAERRKELLKALRRRIEERAGDPEEYMLLLETRNNELEAEHEELVSCRAEIERLNGEIEKFNLVISGHRNEIEKLNERHGRELAEVGARLDEMARERDGERAAHREELRAAEEEYYRELNARDGEHRALLREKEGELADRTEELRKSEEARALAQGRLNALRFEQGYTAPSDDFTSEEAFRELEKEYALFQVFFRGQWKKTKRRIRREMWRALVASIMAQKKKRGETEPAETPPKAETVEKDEQPETAETVERDEQPETIETIERDKEPEAAEGDFPKADGAGEGEDE